jgi:hypothetical protein
MSSNLKYDSSTGHLVYNRHNGHLVHTCEDCQFKCDNAFKCLIIKNYHADFFGLDTTGFYYAGPAWGPWEGHVKGSGCQYDYDGTSNPPSGDGPGTIKEYFIYKAYCWLSSELDQTWWYELYMYDDDSVSGTLVWQGTKTGGQAEGTYTKVDTPTPIKHPTRPYVDATSVTSLELVLCCDPDIDLAVDLDYASCPTGNGPALDGPAEGDLPNQGADDGDQICAYGGGAAPTAWTVEIRQSLDTWKLRVYNGTYAPEVFSISLTGVDSEFIDVTGLLDRGSGGAGSPVINHTFTVYRGLPTPRVACGTIQVIIA